MQIQTSIKVYDSVEELTSDIKELLDLAISNLENAYAPYSNFKVSAALRLENGKIFLGSNQENASYPLCMCAERVALYTAGNALPNVGIKEMVIVAKNPRQFLDKPVAPCGACRQVILEYEQRHKNAINIYLKADGPEVYMVKSASELLPIRFDASFLNG